MPPSDRFEESPSGFGAGPPFGGFRASVALPLGLLGGVLALVHITFVMHSGDGSTASMRFGTLFSINILVLGAFLLVAATTAFLVIDTIVDAVARAAQGGRHRTLLVIASNVGATAAGCTLMLVLGYTPHFFWISGILIASSALLTAAVRLTGSRAESAMSDASWVDR